MTTIRMPMDEIIQGKISSANCKHNIREQNIKASTMLIHKKIPAHGTIQSFVHAKHDLNESMNFYLGKRKKDRALIIAILQTQACL